MLKLGFIFALGAIVAVWGVYSGLFGFALRMLSRIFVSARRRQAPPVLRAGGLAGLPDGLAPLVQCQRAIAVAVDDLRAIAPHYHRSFLTDDVGLREDRRRQGLRRDFEDAVIHVTRALDAWCRARSQLDERALARLTALGPEPDVRGFLLGFRWLPREVHEVRHLHFRSDEPEFEQRLYALDTDLRRLEDALTHDRSWAYR